MPKIKISEMEAAILDSLVAHALGDVGPSGFWNRDTSDYQKTCPHYSTDWAQGGPIIEREGIPTYQVFSASGKMWRAGGQIAETLLVAAMRCYVASKLGDEVEVPKELL